MTGLRVLRIGSAIGLMLCAIMNPIVVAAEVVIERLIASDTSFSRPHDLVLSADGRFLYVADVGNDVVRVLDPQTLATVGRIGGGDLDSPHDVTFDAQGRLWVADSGNDRTVVYEVTGKTGRRLAAYSAEQDSPEGVATASDGRVYVANASRHTVLVLRDGEIVQRLGARGGGADQFSRPHDIHVDPSGRVLIVDPGNNRIQIRDGDLKLIQTLEGPGYDFNEPKYVTVDAGGWLYVADEYNNQIKIFDADYRLQATIGDGHLNKPEGIEVRGDRMWVSDTYNDRILLYRIKRQ